VRNFSFQAIDYQITQNNENVQPDLLTLFSFRVVLYSAYILAMITAFVWPISSLMITLLMDVIWIIFFNQRYWHKDYRSK
jgi:hypothetical protein